VIGTATDNDTCLSFDSVDNFVMNLIRMENLLVSQPGQFYGSFSFFLMGL